ncbi:MAG: PIN domain-containing protein [Acidobacteriota bacterium]
MRVLVDTSAWIDFLNGHSSTERQAVADLIASDHEICTCGVVVAEVFQGLRRSKERLKLSDLFRDLIFLEPAGIDDYFKAADLYRALRERGITIRSTIDCLIAVMAAEHGCSLLARDQDMDRIFESGLLEASRWPTKSLS